MFITFEGIDGSGKSTQARLLAGRLEENGERVLFLREPGGTLLSEKVRSILLDPALTISAVAELLLFSSARAQLVEESIRPELDQGSIVVCDRFFDSTTAYQGGGRGVADLDWLRGFNLHVTGGLIPERTYYLAVPPSIALQRRSNRSEGEEDRMESAGSAFYSRVVQVYEDLVRREPSRIRRLDGCLSVEQLHDQIWRDIQELRLPRDG